jgi:hypothetical protein
MGDLICASVTNVEGPLRHPDRRLVIDTLFASRWLRNVDGIRLYWRANSKGFRSTAFLVHRKLIDLVNFMATAELARPLRSSVKINLTGPTRSRTLQPSAPTMLPL